MGTTFTKRTTLIGVCIIAGGWLSGCEAQISDRCMEACTRELREPEAYCEAYCAAARRLASESGCVSEHQANYDCWAEVGPGGGACESEENSLYNCVELSRPNGCTTRCYECSHIFACQYLCPAYDAISDISACRDEWERLDSCQGMGLPDECPTGLCAAGEREAWNACIESYCASHAEDCPTL